MQKDSTDFNFYLNREMLLLFAAIMAVNIWYVVNISAAVDSGRRSS